MSKIIDKIRRANEIYTDSIKGKRRLDIFNILSHLLCVVLAYTCLGAAVNTVHLFFGENALFYEVEAPLKLLLFLPLAYGPILLLGFHEENHSLLRRFFLILIICGQFILSASAYEYGAIFRKARHGDAKAQYEVGMMYFNGVDMRRVLKNKTKAIEWLSFSADQSYRDAQYELCGIYLSDGEERNIAEAIKWYKRGSNWSEKANGPISRSVYANNIGIAYILGEPPLVVQDSARGLSWLRESEPDMTDGELLQLAKKIIRGRALQLSIKSKP